MSCVFCGDDSVKSYAHCACKKAIKFVNSMKGTGGSFAEKATANCDECNLTLTPQDVTRFVRVDGELANEYKCPSCGHLQIEPRVEIEEKYK